MSSNCNKNNLNKECNSFHNNTCDVDRFILDGSNMSALNWKEIALTELVKLSSDKDCIEAINNVYVDVEIKSAKLIETPLATKAYKVALLDFLGNVVYNPITGDVEVCPCCKTFAILNNVGNTALTGRKIVIEGVVKQKIIYTANVLTQTTHSICVEYPFATYIMAYAKFANTTSYVTDIIVVDPDDPKNTIDINGYLYSHNDEIVIDLCENFVIHHCVEDIFAKLIDCNTIYKSINMFLQAKPIGCY